MLDKLIKKGNYYVWKNKNEEIVAHASFNVNDNNARVTGVYTKPEERRKGYVLNLIYCLTNKLLEKGYYVSLYTDYNYIASNNAYKKVGYIDDDILINFSCKKEKKKNN